jgi:predicted MFS family arabinose efflux permease
MTKPAQTLTNSALIRLVRYRWNVEPIDPSAVAPTPELRDRRVVWRTLTGPGRFGLFFLGAALSNVGTWAQNLAAVVLVYRLSGSTLLVGLVAVAQFLPAVLLAGWAGTVADRIERRRVIAVTQIVGLVLSTVLAAATLAGRATVAVVLLVVLALGAAQAFQGPATLALTPSLVEPHRRDVALSLNSSQFNLARAIGPLVANLLIVTVDVGAVFAFNAGSFLLYLVVLGLLRPRAHPRMRGRSSLLRTLRLVRATRHVVPLMAIGAIVSGTTDPAQTLAPALSVVLVGDDLGAAWMVSAFGAGAVLSAFLLVPVLRRVRRLLPAVIGVQALGLVAVAAAPTLPVALLGMAVCGGAFLIGSNRALTTVQEAVPPEALGRVMALWVVAVVGARPLFALLDGWLGEALGPRCAVAVMAGVALVTALAGYLGSDGRRRVRQPRRRWTRRIIEETLR